MRFLKNRGCKCTQCTHANDDPVDFEHFEKLRFLEKVNNKKVFDSSRQYKQLQLEKPSGIEFDIPILKRLTINLLLRVGQKVLPLGSYRVKVVRSP